MYSLEEIKKIFYKLLVLLCSYFLIYTIDYFTEDRYFFAKPTNIEQKVYRVRSSDFGYNKENIGKGISIVASGGGIKSSYSAGVLLALVDKYNLTDPDILVGSSGSVGNLAYYVAGQYDSIENIWFNLMPTNKVISFVRLNQVLDINYLIDDIFKKQDPLNVERVKNSKIKLFISATDFYTGESRYFTNSDDIFEAMRASKAVPIVFNEAIDIKGGKYIDGEIGSPLYKNIEKAEKEGAKKIIAIDNSEDNPFLTYWFIKVYSVFISDQLSKVVGSFYFDGNKKGGVNSGVSVFYLKPSSDIPALSLDNNSTRIEKSFLLGYNDVLDNKELEEFLKN